LYLVGRAKARKVSRASVRSTNQPENDPITNISASKSEPQPWYVYLLRVQTSNSLYCGITNNLQARIRAHQQGKGAKYLRGKGEIKLEWFMCAEDRSAATKLEIEIKKLSKAAKEKLVKNAPRPYQ
jgi:putative endonuclease